jgi:hypothetical protein
MIKRIMALILMIVIVVGCTAEEAAERPTAETTPDAAVSPGEESGDNPDVTSVPPAGSVDLGELTPEAGEDGDLIVQPAPGVPDPEVKMVQIAAQHLADRLGIDVGEVTLVEAVFREWPDTGLGCPDPDVLYAAVITPGYEITLEAEGESYSYHTDQVEMVVLCVDGRPVVD